jgi:hypothetical protein
VVSSLSLGLARARADADDAGIAAAPGHAACCGGCPVRIGSLSFGLSRLAVLLAAHGMAGRRQGAWHRGRNGLARSPEMNMTRDGCVHSIILPTLNSYLPSALPAGLRTRRACPPPHHSWHHTHAARQPRPAHPDSADPAIALYLPRLRAHPSAWTASPAWHRRPPHRRSEAPSAR